MTRFQILCTTMGRSDFSRIKEMNIHSDVIFTNQADETSCREIEFEDHHAKMITTDTRGVGINRNLGLMYADAEICLFADDDMIYRDGYQEAILREFDAHPEADIIIFNIGTTTPEYGRIPTVIKEFRQFHHYSRNPFGAPRIAFRLQSVRRVNIHFSLLFGGGCPYKTGEDSIWLKDALRAGLKIYLSTEFIGDVSYKYTSSFSDNAAERFYDRGALLAGGHSGLIFAKLFYYSYLRKHAGISKQEAFHMMRQGYRGFPTIRTFQMYMEQLKKEKAQ